jgi:hypothetical protein
MTPRPRDSAAAARAGLRAWWLTRQQLAPATRPRTVDECVRQIGWIPTAGGANVYLTVRARIPGVSRDAVDRAAIDGNPLVEVPGPHARPPVLVPHEEMALALRLHRTSFERHIAPYIRSGEIDLSALRRVGSSICRALDEGPLSSADLRKTVNHADAATLMPGALIDLCLRGIVRRFPAGARLDSPRYLYELLHPDDRPDMDAEGDAAAVAQKATERFLRWHGPATVDELCGWSELARKAARAALGEIGAGRVAIPGWSDEAWLLGDDARAWRAFERTAYEEVVLLPYRDPFVAARRGPAVLTEHSDATILHGGKMPVSISDVSVLHHHTVICGGEVVGVWEYDPKARAVITRVWKRDRGLKARVAEAARETGRFIRDELGDAKLSAVDPPASRARRLAFCREGVR